MTRSQSSPRRRTSLSIPSVRPRPPSGDSPSRPSRRVPGLIVAAVTPFGQDGPWADYLADDLVLMALGGSMAACGYGPSPDGTYDTPPLASLGDQAWRTASTYAAIAVLAALAWRGPSDGGQFIDVSAHECSASMTEWHLMTYICSGQPYRRGPHPTLTAADGRQVAAHPLTFSVPTSSPGCSRCSRLRGWPVP